MCHTRQQRVNPFVWTVGFLAVAVAGYMAAVSIGMVSLTPGPLTGSPHKLKDTPTQSSAFYPRTATKSKMLMSDTEATSQGHWEVLNSSLGLSTFLLLHLVLNRFTKRT